MPANASIVLIAQQVAAATFFLAAATSSPDPVTLARDAAEAAQKVIQMSEEYVLLICFAGGIMGAMVAYSFNLFKGTAQQVALRFTGSSVLAAWAAPYFLLWREIPQTLIPCIFVSGCVGLVAHMLIPIISETFPSWIRSVGKKIGVLPPEESKADTKTQPVPKL